MISINSINSDSLELNYSDTTIEELKCTITKHLGIDNSITLIFNKEILKDDKKLSDYCIIEESTVTMFVNHDKHPYEAEVVIRQHLRNNFDNLLLFGSLLGGIPVTQMNNNFTETEEEDIIRIVNLGLGFVDADVRALYALYRNPDRVVHELLS